MMKQNLHTLEAASHWDSSASTISAVYDKCSRRLVMSLLYIQMMGSRT